MQQKLKNILKNNLLKKKHFDNTTCSENIKTKNYLPNRVRYFGCSLANGNLIKIIVWEVRIVDDEITKCILFVVGLLKSRIYSTRYFIL